MSAPLNQDELDCFIFFLGGDYTPCATCKAQNRCKALLATHGFTVGGDFLDHLITELPPGKYKDTQLVGEMVDQILNPPRVLSKAEQDLKDRLAKKVPTSDLDLDAFI